MHNVGQLLVESAKRSPDHPAVAEPEKSGWKSISFSELDQQTNRLAAGLSANGVEPGKRIALLVPAGIEFVKFVFALFKVRATIVLIDPGMGKKNLIKCLSETRPEGFVGIRKAQIARWIYCKHFPTAKLNFVTDSKWWPGCIATHSFTDVKTFKVDSHPASESAAIIFTTGSTGPPKGVLYSHQNFLHQATQIRDFFQIESGGADISGFPLFALFNTSLGKTTVFPKMDFTRPANIDPRNFLEAVSHWQANQAFGSPALLNTLGRYCEKNKISLPTLERVLSAGAPVPPHVLKRIKKTIAPHGEVHTPYGATEALPVASNNASVVLSETASKTNEGAGVCVGEKFPGIDWKVIAIDDGPLKSVDQVREIPHGEIGELMVAGPVVTTEYVTRTDANALHKVLDARGREEGCQESNRFWHRMGDVGYLDEQDRFWMCGRKSHRVRVDGKTLFTVPCESIINTHPAIYRSALVGLGKPGHQIPVLISEPWPEHWPDTDERKSRLVRELRELAKQHELTNPIEHFLLNKKLPTDIRHNSKIFREQLVDWAANQLNES